MFFKIIRGFKKNLRQWIRDGKNLSNPSLSRVGLHVTLGKVKLAGENTIDSYTVIEGKLVEIGYATTISRNCILRGPIEIGNYTQLGPNVSIFSKDHPYKHITTYSNRVLFGNDLKNLSIEKRVVIGHNVWIGNGATILKGVTIGDGAIIASGSIVNRDVLPYTVVAGQPAKHIKNRFDNDTIHLINKSKWWEMNVKELKKYKQYFLVEIDSDEGRQQLLEFLKQLE